MHRRTIELERGTSLAHRSSIIPRAQNQSFQNVSEEWRDEERVENSSTTSSFLQAAAIPPRLVTQETTPGAVFVPGVLGSFDDSQHDNLLDMEDEIIEGSSHGMISNLSSLRRSQGSTVESPPPTFSVPVVAELAPSNQEVEDRLAERLEAQLEVQISQRLQEEVDRRFAMEKRQHAIAEVIIHNTGINSRKNAGGKEEENFKICGIRRIWWGMIICVIMSFGFAGMGVTFLWYSRAREIIVNDSTRPSIDNDSSLRMPTTTPTISPMFLNPSISDALSSPQEGAHIVDSTATPSPTPNESNEPTNISTMPLVP